MTMSCGSRSDAGSQSRVGPRAQLPPIRLSSLAAEDSDEGGEPVRTIGANVQRWLAPVNSNAIHFAACC